MPTGPQLTQTSATDTTLSFAGPGFIEFPHLIGYQSPDCPGAKFRRFGGAPCSCDGGSKPE